MKAASNGVERNMLMLRQLQAERKAALQQAVEEASLLAQYAAAKGEPYDVERDFPPEALPPAVCFFTPGKAKSTSRSISSPPLESTGPVSVAVARCYRSPPNTAFDAEHLTGAGSHERCINARGVAGVHPPISQPAAGIPRVFLRVRR